MDVLNTGRARDVILGSCARNVWLLTAVLDISLTVSRIQGTKNNVADMLSRWYNTPDNEHKLAKYVTNPVWMNVHINHTLYFVEPGAATATFTESVSSRLSAGFMPFPLAPYTRMFFDFLVFIIIRSKPMTVKHGHNKL